MRLPTTLRTAILVTALAAAVPLAGCTAHRAPAQPPASSKALGAPLSAFKDAIPPRYALIVYDVSLAVVDQPAAYDAGQRPSQWTALAYCTTSDPALEAVVAVIPTDKVTDAIRAKAKSAGYQGLLAECSTG